MIFGYKKNSKEVTLYNETSFKEHSILERQDLEVWVEDYPDILGEDLLIITTEYDKFDKTNERLDLLALDKNGKLVVIELKRDDSGKNVELQALKYAAYCSNLTLDDVIHLFQEYKGKKNKDSDFNGCKDEILNFIDNEEFEQLDDKPRIILVAKNFRSEVTASVLWLRKFNIDISCIKLTPYNISNDEIIFESNLLIPLPEAKDYIIQTERKDNSENTLTVTQKEYLEFFSELKEQFQPFVNVPLSPATKRNYYQIPTGTSGVHFEWAFHGRPRNRFGVELHFETKSKDFNTGSVQYFKNYKQQIESKTGETVYFEEPWGKKWGKLYIEKPEGQITEELKKWAIEKMKTFYELLNPALQKYLQKKA
ncbi:MAG: DUF4268 domain-containing protein [bacterium]